MANILNVSENVFKKLEDENFFNYFVSRSYLSTGDIISIIKKPLHNYIIIGLNSKKIYNSKKSEQIGIKENISKHLKNPIIFYKPISYAINFIEFTGNHIIFEKLLGGYKYDNIKIIFDYKNLKLLKFANRDDAFFLYRIDTILKRDDILIFFIDRLSSRYTIVEKTVYVPESELEEYINNTVNTFVMYWNIISCKQILKGDSYMISIKVNIPEDEIDTFNYKFI
jgi:hypothetical protein